jgi:hypothetical protein
MARVNLTLSANKNRNGPAWPILIFEGAGCVDELTEFDNPAATPGWTTRKRRSGAKRGFSQMSHHCEKTSSGLNVINGSHANE